jgi:hypothetical protein
MAVYQGARRRPGLSLTGLVGTLALPRRLPRRSSQSPSSAGARGHGRRTTLPSPRSLRRAAGVAVGLRRPGSSQVGLVLAAIVIVFSGAFLWLSQSVRVSATNYDIVRLISERDRLDALRVDLRADLNRLAGEPAVRKTALDDGLGQLGAPLVIQPR